MYKRLTNCKKNSCFLMKNLFALNKRNELFHINDVEKELKEKFNCCNCGNELIPRKGKFKAHHFSHKVETNCSYESYLHKLSKLKFYNQYSKCLSENQPFYIDYTIKKTCTSCIEIPNIKLSCNLKDEVKKFDLTKVFDIIHIEKFHQGFISDILLQSSKNEDVLFIEFAVTHDCEKEKKISGIRIIEIKLKDESDLNFINEKHISIYQQNHFFYNFKINHISDDLILPQKCNQKFEVFVIHNSNKTIIKESEINKIISELSLHTFKYYEILGSKEQEKYSGDDFANLVVEFHLKTKVIKIALRVDFLQEIIAILQNIVSSVNA